MECHMGLNGCSAHRSKVLGLGQDCDDQDNDRECGNGELHTAWDGVLGGTLISDSGVFTSARYPKREAEIGQA